MSSQALNTLTNLMVAALVAQVTSPGRFGAWALVYAAYALTLQVSRALVVTPMLIHADVDRVIPPELSRQVRSASLGVGFIASLVLLPVVILFSGSVLAAGVAVVVGLPLMLVQDAMRNEAIRSGASRWAVYLDLVWAVVQSAGVLVLWSQDSMSAGTLTAAWVAGAAAGGLGGLVLARSMPSLRAARTFAREQRQASLRLLYETLLGDSVLQLLPALLALTSGLVVAGAVRAGQTVLGVATFIMAGLVPLITTAAVKRARAGIRAWPLMVWSTVATLVMSVATGVLVAVVPEVGRALAGNSWPLVRTVLLPLVITVSLRGALGGASAVLRGCRQVDAAVGLRVQTTVPALALPLAGGAAWGLQGAAWGMAAASVINALQGWRAMRFARLEPAPDDAHGPGRDAEWSK